MIVGALLANIVDAGTGVLTLAEGMDFTTFQRSRLARAEIGRLVEVMATSLADLPDALRHRFAEIDWSAWAALADPLCEAGPTRDEALWFAVKSLVPATLMWLRVYRESQPEVFGLDAG